MRRPTTGQKYCRHVWDQRQLEVPASGDLGEDKAMFWRTIQVFIFERSCKLSGDWHGTNLNQVYRGIVRRKLKNLKKGIKFGEQRKG